VGSVGVSGYAERQAYSLKIERHTLKLPRWDANGFRIALLADPHVNFVEPVKRAREAALLAMAEKTDVILILGDFVNHRFSDVYNNVGRAFDVLADASCPTYAILGNHDYAVNTGQLISAIHRGPCNLLRNEVVDVNGVSIFGMDDGVFGMSRPERLHEYPVSRSLITLLHEPDYVYQAPVQSSLQVSGHSHGGQLCLPFGIPVSLPRGARRYYGGFFPDAHVPLYVSRGVGTIGIDLRSFCPPEVSILTLESE
jgi:predicted MPP superfamily phosphohydrolase